MYKAIVRPILCAVLVFCVAFGFHVRSAAATSLIVDDASSGANTMFPTTGFESTLSNQNQYNGTSSFQTPTSNTRYFSFSQQIRFSGTLHIKVYAYLWSGTFNNTSAVYSANVFNSYPIRGEMGTLNQNAAEVGWNHVCDQDIQDYYEFFGISVASSSGATTGADAVMITYWID